jgi:hypothetical protein
MTPFVAFRYPPLGLIDVGNTANRPSIANAGDRGLLQRSSEMSGASVMRIPFGGE